MSPTQIGVQQRGHFLTPFWKKPDRTFSRSTPGAHGEGFISKQTPSYPSLSATQLKLAAQMAAGSYINLPSPGSKQAPKTFKGHHRDVERFITHFEYLCTQKGVIDDKEKCLGFVQYCSYDVADLIEGLDEYTSHDYGALLKKFQHLYDGGRRKGEYHIGHIEEFTRAWRGEEIQALETFKQYHREYIQVAGVLKTSGRIDTKEFNRGFWEGLNRDTRDRIERRMTDDDPRLDLTIPFDTSQVVKAAEHIFNRNRFDKHLREGRAHYSIEEKKGGKKRSKTRRDTDEEHSEKESDEEEEVVPFWKKNRTLERTERTKSVTVSAEKPLAKKREEKDEINDLVSKLESLAIDQPQYRATYVQLCLRAPKISDLYPRPTMPNVRSYAALETRDPPDERTWRDHPDERMRRDPPPHQSLLPPDRRFPDRRFEDRRDLTCYGCGNTGHTMNQCAKLEALIDQGHIRRIIGKLRWADGSNIVKEPEESWASAVVRRLPQRENVTRTTDEKEQHKGVYLIEIARDDSDADSDEQEEMGWRSGTTTEGNLQAYGAERTTRISKEAKQGAQRQHLLPKTHRVKEFPTRGHLHEPGRKEKGSIPRNADLNRGQNRFEEIPVSTPVDVSPAKFKGELDSQLVPMEVEEVVVRKVGNQRRKVSTRDLEGTIRDVGQTRAKRGKAQSEVVNGLLSLPLTLSLQEIASISPSVRRDLATTLKAIRDDQKEESDLGHVDEQTGPKALGGKREGGGGLDEMPMEVFLGSLDRVAGREARSDLLKIEITIGKATMIGVVDSGSMINMISAKKLEESGLPSAALKEKSFKITGVNGGTSRCHSWIPGATIYVSEDKRATYGDVYILEEADFEFIAGRPWSTLNGGRIVERGRGTYVSWITGDERYEINVSKASGSAARAVDAQAQGDTTEEESIAALVVRITKDSSQEQSCVLDSQEGQDELDYGEYDGPGVKDDYLEGNQLAQEEAERWGMEKGEDGDDEKEQGKSYRRTPTKSEKGKARQREEDVRPTPDRPKKRPCIRKHQNHRIVVDQDVEEGFARLVQTGANDEEWEKFCGKEQRRLARGDQRWFDWMDTENEDYAPLEIKEPSQSHDHQATSAEESSSAEPRNSAGGSHTLGTPPKFVPKTTKTPPSKKEQANVTAVVGRRSSRLTRETTCSTCGGAPMNQQKTYQRKERATRTLSRQIVTTSKQKKEEDEPKILSYGLRRMTPDDEPRELIKEKLVPGRSRKEASAKRAYPDPRKEGPEFEAIRRNIPELLQTDKEQRVIRALPRRNWEKSPLNVRGSKKGVQRASARQLSVLRGVATRQQKTDETDDSGGRNLSINDLEGYRNTANEERKAPSPQDKQESYAGRYQAEPLEPDLEGQMRNQPQPHEPYLTWEEGKCILQIPDERFFTKKPTNRSQIPAPQKSAHRGSRLPSPKWNAMSRPASSQKRILDWQKHARPRDVDPGIIFLRSLRQEFGTGNSRQNIHYDGEVETGTDGSSIPNSKGEKTARDRMEHSPGLRFKELIQDYDRMRERSDEKKHEKNNNWEARSHRGGKSQKGGRAPIKEKVEKKQSSNSQNWRQKPPPSLTTPKRTLKNRTILLLLLSLPLIPLLLAYPPTKSSFKMVQKSKPNDHRSSIELGPAEHPSELSGDRSSQATLLGELVRSLDRPRGEGRTKKDLGIFEVPSVDRKNPGTLEGEPYDPSSRTSLPANHERFDKVTAGPSHRSHEKGEDRDQKEAPVQPRANQERLKVVDRNLGYHEITLGVTKKDFKGGVQPFSGEMEDEEDEGVEGNRPPQNSPVGHAIKIGPPKFRRPGKVRTLDDLVSFESKARAKEAERGSEIKIVYHERKRSPLPSLEFWQGLAGITAAPSSQSSGITSSSPSRAASLEQPTETTMATTIRSVDEILPEIVEILSRLKNELKMALDVETRLLIHEVDVDARGMLELRKGKKDKDGDVVMEREDTHPEGPVPTYYQPSTPESGEIAEPGYTPRSPDQGELLRRMEAAQEGVESLQWKMVNLEDHNERIAALETRMKAKESQKRGNGWTAVRPPSRREVERPITRSQTQRAESAVGKDVVQLQTRMTALERAVEKGAKGGDNNRKRVNGLDMRVGGAEGEAMACRKKVAELEKKEEENPLRQALAVRELTQAQALLAENVSSRMARVEARLLELEYRTVTTTEQIQWNDQKIRGIWHAFNSPNPEEACLRTAALRQIWVNASGSYARRHNNIPYASPPARLIENASSQQAAPGSSPRKEGKKPPSS